MRDNRRAWLLWPAIVFAAAVVALVRDLPVAAAFYMGVAVVDVVAGLALARPTGAWWGMGQPGFRRIAWAWLPVALCHWCVATAFYLGPDAIGAMLVMVAGLPAFFMGALGYAHSRYMTLIARELEPGERLLAVCSGVKGQPPGHAVVAATDRRFVEFALLGRARFKFDRRDSIERADVTGVDITPAEDAVRVAVRGTGGDLVLDGAGRPIAEHFARAAAAA